MEDQTIPIPMHPTKGDPGSTPPGRRRWLRMGLPVGLILVLVLAATAVMQLLGQKDSGDASTAATPTAAAPTAAAPTATAPADARPPVDTQMGIFVGADPNLVREFTDWLGRDVPYVVDFSSRQNWAQIAEPQHQIDTWKDQPYRKVFSLAMLPDDPADTIERGATGEYNHYFADLARRFIAANQEDTIFRIGWEFNIGESRWSTDNPEAFIAYWRHIVTTMKAQPGQQFQFDWNPNNADNKYDAAKYYPGSDVVDYIGIDAYDVSWAAGAYPYPENCDATCRTAAQKIAWDQSIYGGARGLRFWSEFARQQGKPMSLPEWGLWNRLDNHGGGANLDYLRRMHEFITDPANRVAYQAYFEYNGPDGPHKLMTTFPRAGELFRTLFAK